MVDESLRGKCGRHDVCFLDSQIITIELNMVHMDILSFYVSLKTEGLPLTELRIHSHLLWMTWSLRVDFILK
jgi:hypothetical protein